MTGIIIQARISSTRLPNKLMVPFFKGKGILELLIEKLKYNISDLPIILATTQNAKDDILASLGTQLEINVFRGDENNVLDRFIAAGENHCLKQVIRICADNPFLDVSFLKQLIHEHNNSLFDYTSFKTKANIPVIRTHYGFWAEAVSLSALNKIKKLTYEKIYLEHVTNYIYNNEQLFSRNLIKIPEEFENHNIRLTIDTIDDFVLAKEIYEQAVTKEISGALDLVHHISNNPEWIYKMKNQIEQNEK